MILFALREEAGPCRDFWRKAGLEVAGKAEDFHVEKGGRRHRVLVCGPGADNVQECLDREEPDSLIHAGFAGALRPDWLREKLLVVSAVQQGNATHETPRTESYEALLASGCLPAVVESVAGPLDQEAKIKFSLETPADLVDMETATALNWARERSLPYTGLRIVSDRLADDIPEAVTRSWDGRRFRVGRIVAQALRHPTIVPELNELRLRSRRLATRLAEAMLPLL